MEKVGKIGKKVCAGLSIQLVAMLVCTMAKAVASASVIDSALVWRSGDGLDPSGAFATAAESVPSIWSGRETEQTVLKINQTKAESLSIPLSGVLPANCHTLTMYMRCKWDGDFFSGDRAGLFSYGNTWGQYRGSNFSFINQSDGTASVRWDCGRNQGPQTSPKVLYNTWYDVFMTIEDPSPNATAAQPEVRLAFHESGHKAYDTTKGASAPAYVATLDQALSLIAADDSAAGEVVAVIDEGTAKAREIRLHSVAPGKESLGYVERLPTGGMC